MKMQEIKLHYDFKKILSKEFNVTEQTISMALKYVFNSDKAKQIRLRAKELLEQEANNIQYK